MLCIFLIDPIEVIRLLPTQRFIAYGDIVQIHFQFKQFVLEMIRQPLKEDAVFDQEMYRLWSGQWSTIDALPQYYMYV